MASRPSSHCTRTSGRATPVGPAHPHGRLGRKTSSALVLITIFGPVGMSYHVGLGETAELRDATLPSKFTPPLLRPPICSSIRPNAIYNQTHPDDDNALAVLSYAIAHIPSSERSASSPPFPFLVSSLTTRDSCRRPHELRWCPGGSSGHDELLPSTSGAGAPTLAHAARQVRQEARRRQSVTVQMKNVANSQPVHKA